jgi:hypothetical protein
LIYPIAADSARHGMARSHNEVRLMQSQQRAP